MVQDFSPSNSFTWDPLQEGTYNIQVTVKDSYSDSTGESATRVLYGDVAGRWNQRGDQPDVQPPGRPVQRPPLRRQFDVRRVRPAGPQPVLDSTAPLPIVPGESTNFIVAGMLPNTTYLMRYVLNDGTTSAPLTFTTGSLPTNVTFPTFTEQQAPAPGTDLTQDMILHAGLGDPAGTITTVATDLQGNVVWYYDSVANNFPNYATSLVPGGTVLMLGGDVVSGLGGFDTVREIDLAGDTLRETNIDAVNAELAAMGQHPITDFDHDAQRLPNGDTAVLAMTPRTINVNGIPTAV